jgi:hypothetical protein
MMVALDGFEVKHISELQPEVDQGVTVMTKEEWVARGKQLFGDDLMKWRFVCPGCGHIQAVEDFRQYKEQGAKPDDATCKCIGRFSGGVSWANTDFRKAKGPCDYTGYGLFNLCPVKVVDSEKEIRCFAFDESEEVKKE